MGLQQPFHSIGIRGNAFRKYAKFNAEICAFQDAGDSYSIPEISQHVQYVSYYGDYPRKFSSVSHKSNKLNEGKDSGVLILNHQ